MVKMYAMGRRTSVPNVAMPMIHVIPMTTSREMELLAQYLCEVCREEGYNWRLAVCMLCLTHTWPQQHLTCAPVVDGDGT